MPKQYAQIRVRTATKEKIDKIKAHFTPEGIAQPPIYDDVLDYMADTTLGVLEESL